MTTNLATTNNFVIDYDPADFPGPAKQALVKRGGAAIALVCEQDFTTLCGWFRIPVNQGFGPANRIRVTITSQGRGAANEGYSKNGSKIQVTLTEDTSDQSLDALFVAELIEVLMSYTGFLSAGDSYGEGISRVAALLLHPTAAFSNNVNAWLQTDPTRDCTSAVADSAFRKDWVTHSFTGGALRSGGHVPGDQDSYSTGCAVLFINYLQYQLEFTIDEIIQNHAGSLGATYQKLTNGGLSGFRLFRDFVDAHFAPPPARSDQPFPLPPARTVRRHDPAPGEGRTACFVSGDRYQHTVLLDGQGVITDFYRLADGCNPAPEFKKAKLAVLPGATGAITGYYAVGEQTSHVLALDRRGALHDYSRKPGQGVIERHVTQVNVPGAVMGGYWSSDDERHHAIMGGTDGSVSELSWLVGGLHLQQNPLQGFAVAVTAVCGYFAAADRYQRVLVGMADGSLTELYWRPSQGVNLRPIHQFKAAVESVGGYFWSGDGRNHVIVATSDGTISEVSWRPARAVRVTDVETGIQGRVSLGAYAIPDNGGLQHLITSRSDGSLVETHWSVA